MYNKFIYFFISFVLIQYYLISFFDIRAQEINKDSAESFHVEWIKNWSSSDNKQTQKKLKNRLNLILFGIKTPELIKPVSVFATNPDNFWVLDQGGKTLFKIKDGNGEIPRSIINSNYDLSSLVSICATSASNFLFTDSKSNIIYQFVVDRKKIGTLNDSLKLEQPTGIAYLSAKKEIWVVETNAHRISILNERGELLKRIGIRGNAKGEFNFPTHIWIDKKGFVYINDAMNFRIQVLNSEGEVIAMFGKAGDASGFFGISKGIATDSYGNIYIVDVLFHVVQVFDIKGNFLYSFGSQGHENSQFWMPSGIYIDEQNYIYVSDTYNSRIQIFQLKHTK